MHRGLFVILALSVSLSAWLGCGPSNGVKLGEVTGVVTLDGKPLPNATVSFSPQEGGRASEGVTDQQGKYLLRFTGTKDGAMVGAHSVKVNVGVPMGEQELPPGQKIPQLPAKYNTETQLTAEVESGTNTIDFALTSQ